MMLRKPVKGKDSGCSLRVSAPTEENHQGPQVILAAESAEKEELFLSGTKNSEAARSLLNRHHDREYKVPFVKLLQSPHRQELSLRSSLDSGLQLTKGY